MLLFLNLKLCGKSLHTHTNFTSFVATRPRWLPAINLVHLHRIDGSMTALCLSAGSGPVSEPACFLSSDWFDLALHMNVQAGRTACAWDTCAVASHGFAAYQRGASKILYDPRITFCGSYRPACLLEQKPEFAVAEDKKVGPHCTHELDQRSDTDAIVSPSQLRLHIRVTRGAAISAWLQTSRARRCISEPLGRGRRSCSWIR